MSTATKSTVCCIFLFPSHQLIPIVTKRDTHPYIWKPPSFALQTTLFFRKKILVHNICLCEKKVNHTRGPLVWILISFQFHFFFFLCCRRKWFLIGFRFGKWMNKLIFFRRSCRLLKLADISSQHWRTTQSVRREKIFPQEYFIATGHWWWSLFELTNILLARLLQLTYLFE